MIKRFIPDEYFHKASDIDYKKLYESGFRTVFFDLDNTLADYETHTPSEELINLFKTIKDSGLTPLIISNNHKKRVSTFGNALKIDYLHDALKPFLFKIRKFMKKNNYNFQEIVWIGDQIVTDIALSHKMNIYSILVDPIRKETEHWYTRINRMFERKHLKIIKKLEPEEYTRLKLGERNI